MKHSWFRRNLPDYLATECTEQSNHEIDDAIFQEVMKLEKCRDVERPKAIYAIHHAKDLLTLRRYNSSDYRNMRRVAMSYSILSDRKKNLVRLAQTKKQKEPLEDTPTPSQE